MVKKNIFKCLLATDFHISPENCMDVEKVLLEGIEIAGKKHISTHIWLGDIFDSRIAQRKVVLSTFHRILEAYDNAGQTIYCIPGNHDKTVYSDKESFLDVYKHHPSFHLIDEMDGMEINGVYMFFLPFFSDNILVEEMESMGSKPHKVLFGHFAVTGSKNNDGSIIESPLTPSIFYNFEKVYLGHYHDYQEVGNNIFHLGSLQQNNFGEDDNKGFWLFDEAMGVTLIKPESGASFKKLVVDLDEMNQTQIEAQVKSFHKENPNSRLRVEIWGGRNALQSVDKEFYTALGIDCKKKLKEVEKDIFNKTDVEVKILTADMVVEKFKGFCKDKSYDEKEGLEILNQIVYGQKVG